MSSPALELLARVIAQQLATATCESCGGTLGNGRVKMRTIQVDHAIVEVTCSGCDHVMLLQVKPDGDGVAGLR